MADSKNSMSVDMTFSIAGGAVNAQANGRWPALPNPPPTPAQPTNHFFWYLSRTSGLAAYILLFVSVCLGLTLRLNYRGRVMERWRALDVHQSTALLAMLLLVVHVFSLLGDRYFNYNLAQLLIPFASPYRQFWTALGVVGFYICLAIGLTTYLRQFFGNRAWRVLHSLSALLFVASLLHSAMAGTDTAAMWAKWLYISTGTVTAFLFLWRYVGRGSRVASSNEELANRPVGVESET
jgi:predicted ferric reductase